MSELQLSGKLISDIKAVLEQHDAGANDPGVCSQYLCAVVGYMLGQQEMPPAQKNEVLDELSSFMKHVVDDVSQQQRPKPAAPAPPPIDAFGIWKPKS
ncbi:MAG: hypothetical protein V3U65_01035 [Granulosicoccaceae bacterium]